MRLHAKRMVLKIVILTAILFLAIWGTNRIVGGTKNSMADVQCNSNAINISGSDEERALCLQDMNDSVKASMDEEYEHYALADSRDGNTYYISKLADGNVWMTQNLGLGTTGSAITLSPMDTDISTDSVFTTLPKAASVVDSNSINTVNFYTVHDSFIEGGGIYIQPSGSFARDIVRVENTGSGHYRLGNGYPWTVATAQTTNYVAPSNQGDINMTPSDSICPAGWKLPSQEDYKNLLIEYNLFEENGDSEGSEETSSSLRFEPFYFIRGFPYLLGTDGYYWTSTTSEEAENYHVARVFFVNGYHSGSSYRTAEISGDVGAIRCIARTDSDFTYTLSYNLNGASGSIDNNVIKSSRKQVSTTVTTTTPTWAHHNFLGWAESSSATAASYSSGASITLGGDKTLYAVWEVVVSDQEVSFAQSSINKTFGDAKFTNTATTTGDGTITYSSNNTAVATIDSSTGEVTIVGAGNATITATAAATQYYNSASATYSLTVNKATPTVSFTNTAVAKTYGDASFTNAATATSGGAISYQSNNTDVAVVDSTSGEVTIIGAGNATITATAAATSNYNSASATYSLTVSRSAITISFDNTAITKTYGDSKFTNVATTISDGAITYSSNNTAVATINSTTGEVTIAGAGNATITASVSATANYEAASTTYSLTINKATPTVSFTNTAVSKVYGDAKFTNTATATSDGTISYQSNNTNVATVDGSTGEITIVGVGSAAITAVVAATNNYNSASTTFTLSVGKATPIISLTNAEVTKTYGDAKFTNAATATSDGTISYQSNNTNVATVDDASGEVTIIGAGNATITASVSATANYVAASTTYSLTVNKKTSVAPDEIGTVKTGYINAELSTIHFNTVGLVWADDSERIREGDNRYAVTYTENGDTDNYTTESFEVTVLGEKRIYSVIDGDGQSYRIKSGKEIIRFTIGANYSLFEDGGTVYVDGALLDAQYYTAESGDGGTIISISAEYLDTLDASEHSLQVLFANGGEATASFIVEPEEKEEEPEEDEEEDILPVPDTGSVMSSNNGNDEDILFGMLPEGVIVGIIIGGYLYNAKKNHRRF